MYNSPTKDLMSGPRDGPASVDGIITPEDVAISVVQGLKEEEFYILPHPQVVEYLSRKGDDIDRWLAGMHRFQQKIFPDGNSPGDWLIS